MDSCDAKRRLLSSALWLLTCCHFPSTPHVQGPSLRCLGRLGSLGSLRVRVLAPWQWWELYPRAVETPNSCANQSTNRCCGYRRHSSNNCAHDRPNASTYNATNAGTTNTTLEGSSV